MSEQAQRKLKGDLRAFGKVDAYSDYRNYKRLTER
jgi:hypothetical protein